jgi:dihydrofolate reductase
MKISLVVVVDEAWGIGLNNQLLCHLPADLQHFKKITLGKPILMGRKTFESIGKPLPGRQNIVLSHQRVTVPGVTSVTSLEAAWRLLQNEPEVMVIGGAQLFEQTLPLASQVYLTRIHHQFSADTFFPELALSEWQEMKLGEHEIDDRHAYGMTFYLYTPLIQKPK